jgi:hypothetical protein
MRRHHAVAMMRKIVLLLTRRNRPEARPRRRAESTIVGISRNIDWIVDDLPIQTKALPPDPRIN